MDSNTKVSILVPAIILLVSSLLLIPLVNAQLTPKPAVPEFTASYVDLSYDVPSTTSINKYTGQTETNQGYHVENKTIQLTIRNQPFTSRIENGQNVSFYYNVRGKGSFSNQWIEVYSSDIGYPAQSRTETTTITFVLGNSSRFGYTPPKSQIDFQVQALIGSIHRISNITEGNRFPWELFPWIFDGQTSEWSNTQTITIPPDTALDNSIPNPTSNTIVTTTQNESINQIDNNKSDNSITLPITTLALIVVIAIFVTSVIAILLHTRTKNQARIREKNNLEKVV